MQGYLFSRAVTSTELATLLTQKQPLASEATVSLAAVA
jgi:EAL domain-containing protein (putative c-di-GMP-specific phosphodiesterase class I)